MSANFIGSHRRVYTRLWGDAKFRELDPASKMLWMYLLTAPETCPLPGIHIGRQGQLTESAMLPDREAFDRAFAQLETLGMVKADWDARVVWLPNTFRYNQPLNPSVTVAWVREVAKLPECALRDAIGASLFAHVSARGEAFAKAVRKAGLRADGGLNP